MVGARADPALQPMEAITDVVVNNVATQKPCRKTHPHRRLQVALGGPVTVWTPRSDGGRGRRTGGAD